MKKTVKMVKAVAANMLVYLFPSYSSYPSLT